MEGIFFNQLDASSADLAELRLDECGGLIDAGGGGYHIRGAVEIIEQEAVALAAVEPRD